MKRRALITFQFLGLMYALSAQIDVDRLLIARNTGVKELANGDTIRVFGFAEGLMDQPGVPGPTIFANEGDSVRIDLWNVSQGAPHTIHLHGLDVDQQNDGVPHLSFDVPHMEHGYYYFKAPHAGTYLYHCHVVSTIHVQAGMYGLIIIKPTDGSNTTWNGGYPFDDEYSFFLSEIDTTWHNDAVLEHDHDTSLSIHFIEIPKFDPQFFLINGRSDNQLLADSMEFNSSVGRVNYVRLTNIGYSGNRIIFPAGLNATIIDSDGRPLPQNEINDTVVLYPGERYGVLCEADIELTDSIYFEYFSMNTMEVKNTQKIPVNISTLSKVSEDVALVSAFDVFPNPFSDQTRINFQLIKAGQAKISVYDIHGKRFEDINLGAAGLQLAKGNHSILFGKNVRAGLYIVRLEVDGIYTDYRKIVKQ